VEKNLGEKGHLDLAAGAAKGREILETTQREIGRLPGSRRRGESP